VPQPLRRVVESKQFARRQQAHQIRFVEIASERFREPLQQLIAAKVPL